jgi:hypothetical protein
MPGWQAGASDWVGVMPVDDRLILILGYGTVFVSTALWTGHRFWPGDRDLVALAARGSNVLAVLLLSGGLMLYGFQVGYWPLHTAYELLNIGLLGLLLALLMLLSPQHHGLFLVILSALSSLVAVYGLWVGGSARPATFVYDSGWWTAYVALSSFGGGAMVVSGVAAVAGHSRRSETSEGAATQRALTWSLLTLSTGLASGAWWFYRLSGRYWGDVRWAGIVVVGLLGAAVWHGRRKWLGRGWRSVLVGIILGLAGGYVLLGLGGR